MFLVDIIYIINITILLFINVPTFIVLNEMKNDNINK